MSEAKDNRYPMVNSNMTFSWQCTECYKLNHLTWGNFYFYGDTMECTSCEKPHTINVPWMSIKSELLKKHEDGK